MPELPDLTVYLEALRARVLDQVLTGVRRAPAAVALLRTAVPPLGQVHGRRVLGLSRLGKRLVLALEGELFLVLHLMIAGRLRWAEPAGAAIPGKIGLAAFDFPAGTLLLTEASAKKRAALHVVRGSAALEAHDPGGLEPLEMTLEDLDRALRRERHTLKRTLTDPTTLAGIGNAYSDEILHAARLSPTRMSDALTTHELVRLHAAIVSVLTTWTARLRAETGAGFPEKVTAFRDGMATHGRFGKPCPVCETAIQRIVHGEHETNYCPRCQTGGKLLADRSLSRLLHADWPKTVDALEARRQVPRP